MWKWYTPPKLRNITEDLESDHYYTVCESILIWKHPSTDVRKD